MRPFYADDWLTLYLGDALTVLRELPASSVDAVLTDPPYSSGAATLAAKQAPPRRKYQDTSTIKTYPAMLGDGRDQRSFTLWATLWLTECWRVARDAAPLIMDLMEIVPQGGTVLDPFLGGGTTAAAAKSTGRTCVGCELSPEYAAITRERIQATTAQPDASPVRPD